MYLELPGSNPKAHHLPTFLWPGGSFLIWIEHVPDTSRSRVNLVNSSDECDSSTYEIAMPVVQVGFTEQLIEAYLVADVTKRMVCFFELPTSMALVIATSTGEQFEFPQAAPPTNGLIVEGVVANYVHRGLPANVILSSAEPGENGQVFIIEDVAYEANGGQCLPAVGIGGAAEAIETAEEYIARVAKVQLKDAFPMDDGSHFITLNEEDTQAFVIGGSYIVCYVGDKRDSTRVFNKVGESLLVRDIITNVIKDTAFEEAGGKKTTSEQTRLSVEASLEGRVSCFIVVRRLDRTPVMEEIRNTYSSELPEDFVPAFDESEVLGRTLDVDVLAANSVTPVVIDHLPYGNAAGIRAMPMGVAPQVYTWCYHDQSSIVYPDSGDGVSIELSVLEPPDFQYQAAFGAVFEKLVLARNVSFPPFSPAWQVEGFPIYYYDAVQFSITPTLPAGIELESDAGQIRPDPPDQQLLALMSYTIKAQSVFDLQKAREVSLSLTVQEPGYCALQSIKSTEALLACTLHDANNFYNEAIYLLFFVYGAATPAPVSSSFSCYGDAAAPASEPAPGILDFTCQRVGSECCCWLWVPGGSDRTERNVDISRSLTGRVSTSGQCGMSMAERYIFMTLAAGVNPLSDMQESGVVYAAGDEAVIADFTVPERTEAKPIQFEMKVDINYEEVCDPVINGAEAEEQCKAQMQAELVALLGAPPEMITVRSVRPG